MANTTTTIAQAEEMIRQRITSNDSKAITGQALQDVLLGITSGVKLKTEENSKNIVTKTEELRNLVNVEVTARIGANEKMLKRIKGISSDSSAYTDPFRYLEDYKSEKDASGTITKHAIRVMQDTLLDTLRHSDFNDSLPYIGKMKAHIEGVPIEAWNYVKTWNQGSNNGIFVQVVRTNYALSAGVISSAATSEYHEYQREVTVAMSNGLVTSVTATPFKEITLTETDRTSIDSIAFLGDFNRINEVSEQAATVQYAGNADYVLLRFRIGGKGGLILQNVNGNSTEQYLFNDGKRYVRYVDFTSDDRTAVNTVQDWKLDGVAYIFYAADTRIIHLRNQWGETIQGDIYSTLPLVSSQYAGLLSNTAFTHLSNFNIYEHSVPTATSVRLTFTKPLTGEAGVATLAAATSARAGVMTAGLYNELKKATTDINELTARIEEAETDRTSIDSIAFLGDFNSIDAASRQAATVQYAGNADYVILRFRIGGKGGLILQNVNGNSTEQYLFNDGKRYVRYVDFTSADRTAVKKVQAWKLDGVAYIFYDSAKRIIYQRNQWDENISGGGPSTLPLVSSQHAGLLSNTAFTHLSNFNIYEHSVPTATSVRLTFTKPLTGEAGVATLAAATSARAGVMTAGLYNELKKATEGVATAKSTESEHYSEMQNHLTSIYNRLAAAERKIAQLEQRLATN